MSIRSAAKAIVLDGNNILLNFCSDRHNGEYYSLPGGGQNDFETLHEAIVRECLEETGYQVVPERFAALCEEICLHEGFRQKYPDYAHKMYHIFICRLAEGAQVTPTETDIMQVGTKWIDIGSIKETRILPTLVGDAIEEIVAGTSPVFLGSEKIEFNHG